MKFSHSLVFSVVPEWQSYYIAYDTLKSAIYRFEKEALHSTAPTGDLESAALLGNGDGAFDDDENAAPSDRAFALMLDKELAKVVDFYGSKERELLGELQLLQQDVERSELDETLNSEGLEADDDDDDDDDSDGEQGATSQRRALYRAAAKFGLTGSPPSSARRKRNPRRPRGMSVDSDASRTDELEGNGQSRQPHLGDIKETEPDRIDVDAVDASARDADADAAARPRPTRPPAAGAGERSPSRPRRRSTIVPGSSRPKSTRRSRALSVSASEDFESVGGRLAAANSVWAANSDYVVDIAMLYKRRMTELFTNLSELKGFVDLNRTGFRKILKKYDKITGSNLKDRYLAHVVDTAFPFEEATQTRLASAIQHLVPLYARVVTRGDEALALRQLKTHLREHVVWERNTIWREMIGLERQGWGNRGSGGLDKPIAQDSGDESGPLAVSLPVGGKLRLPSWMGRRSLFGGVAIALFLGIALSNAMGRPEETNCLALLGFVTIMWAAEVIPLFVTSLLVPLLVVTLRVVRVDGVRLSAPDATKFIFGSMFSPTIMLLIGGFTLAAALSKHNIDKVLAAKVLSLAGTRPSTVLVAYMGVACFASMWISNVAAPVLCYSLIQPILRTLPPKSSFNKPLILGIALASNIGGQSSPISSPQNLIALEYMDPPLSWLSWFAVAIPVSALTVVLIWLLLLWSYGSGRGTIINPMRQPKDPFSPVQWFVLAVAAATIVLWCVEHQIQDVVGDMGIIALVPLIVFFGTGVLRKSDFDNFPWSIVFLAMGGIALGKAVLASGLLADVDDGIERLVQGLDIWPVLAVFAAVALVIATFISHTVASVLLVPVAAQIGAAMESPHPRLLIFATALVCSAGCALPVSGFPNQTAINLENDVGQRYLTTGDFLKNGIPASIIATLLIVTLGFLLMTASGL